MGFEVEQAGYYSIRAAEHYKFRPNQKGEYYGMIAKKGRIKRKVDHESSTASLIDHEDNTTSLEE